MCSRSSRQLCGVGGSSFPSALSIYQANSSLIEPVFLTNWNFSAGVKSCGDLGYFEFEARHAFHPIPFLKNTSISHQRVERYSTVERTHSKLQ